MEQLIRLIDALRREKDVGQLSADPKWLAFFDDRARRHFWWPTQVELDDWLRQWQSTPLQKRSVDPSLKTPWTLDSLIDAFANADYRLEGVRRIGDRARIEFEPSGYPYGGTGALEALAEAFEQIVVEIWDGSEPPYQP